MKKAPVPGTIHFDDFRKMAEAEPGRWTFAGIEKPGESMQLIPKRRGPQPDPQSPEGLGAMMAQNHPDAGKLYSAMKKQLPLHTMDKVEGGVIGRIFSDHIDDSGVLDAKSVAKALNGLPADTKKELWGARPEAVSGLIKFSECIAALQECQKKAKGSAAKLTDDLSLSYSGPELNGAAKVTIPWRYLANPQIVGKLCSIADRACAIINSGKDDRPAIIKAMQQNSEDAQKIHLLLSAAHNREEMAQV
jgi:hypothetical protein